MIFFFLNIFFAIKQNFHIANFGNRYIFKYYCTVSTTIYNNSFSCLTCQSKCVPFDFHCG